MAANAELNLVIGVVDKASGPLGKLSGALGGIAKIGGAAFLGGAVAGIGALGAALVTGIGDARDAALVFAQTEAVIKSTGGAAGFTADQIAEMAGSLSAASGKSLFGDDDIQRGQNMLLTFTNITTQLPAATQTMLDMATALGTDAGGAAVQLGKALNDPIAGISALSRVGVTFSEDQKAMIASLMETGDVAGAQAVILAELNKEFGGSAAAAAAADGGFTQFKDRMGELAESIGAQVLPLLNQLLAWLNSEGVQTAIANIGTGLVNAVKAAATGFDSFMTAIQPVIGFVTENMTPILAGLATMLIAVVVPAFVTWATAAGTAALATILALAPVIAPIAAIGAAVALLVTAWDRDWGGMRTTLTAWWTTSVKPIVDTVKAWLDIHLPVALAALSAAWDVVWAAIKTATAVTYDWLKDNVWPWLESAFNAMKDTVLPALSTGFSTAWSAISTAVSTVYTYFKDTVWPWLQTAMTNIGIWINTAKDTWSTAWGLISGAVTTAKNTISGVIDTIKDIVKGAIDRINDLIGAINSIPGINIPTIPNAPTGGGSSGFGGRSVGTFTPLGGISGHPGGSVTSNTVSITINATNRADAELGVRDALMAAGLL